MYYYTVDDVEELTYTCPEEAAIAWCENLLEEDEIPEFVWVEVYEADVVKPHKLSSSLDGIYDELDEEYGSPFDDPTEIPDSVKTKYRELVEEIVKTYEVWKCVPTGNTVRVPTKGLFSE